MITKNKRMAAEKMWQHNKLKARSAAVSRAANDSRVGSKFNASELQLPVSSDLYPESPYKSVVPIERQSIISSNKVSVGRDVAEVSLLN